MAFRGRHFFSRGKPLKTLKLRTENVFSAFCGLENGNRCEMFLEIAMLKMVRGVLAKKCSKFHQNCFISGSFLFFPILCGLPRSVGFSKMSFRSTVVSSANSRLNQIEVSKQREITILLLSLTRIS